MLRAVFLLVFLAGCPSFAEPTQVACGEDDACPSGRRCETLLDVCVADSTPPVAGLEVDAYPEEIEALAAAPALTARLVDASGRMVRISGGTFTLEADVELAGTLSAAAADGAIVFAGFQVVAPGGPITLRVRGGDLMATSGSFRVRPTTPTLELLGASSTPYNCQRLGYRLGQAQGLPVDLVVEVDPDGAGPRGYQRATQGPSEPGEAGIVALPTTPSPRTRQYTWDATTDVPGVDAEAELRLSTRLGGREGPAVTTKVTLHHAGKTPRCRRLELPLVGSALGGDTSPNDVLLIDLDVDGKADVLSSGKYLELASGRGDGSFMPARALGLSLPVLGQLLAGDLDRDGAPDVVATGVSGGGLSILWNDPVQAAQLVVDGLAHEEPTVPLSVGDLDGDGWPDLILASGRAIEIRRHMPGAARSFRPGEILPLDLPRPSPDCLSDCQVELADLDLDGVPELLVRAGRQLSVHRQDPFHPGTYLTGDVLAFEIDHLLGAADLFDDARPEIVVRNSLDGLAVQRYLVLALDEEDGAVVRWESASDERSAQELLADLNGDGRLDLVVEPVAGYLTTGWVDMVAAELAGGTPAPRPLLVRGPFAADDLDGDGHLDLVGVLGARVFVARGAAIDDLPAVRSLPDLAGFGALLAADLAGDGRPELVAQAKGSVYLAWQDDDSRLDLEILGKNQSLLGLVDVEGDGHAEVLTRTETSIRVVDLAGQEVASCTVEHPFTDAATGDVDGDGALDLVYAYAISVYVVRSFTVACSPAEELYNSQSQGFRGMAAARLGDLNGDGLLDLIVGGAQISTALQTEQPGVFAPPTWGDPLAGIGFGAYEFLRPVDFDRDGRLDVLASAVPVSAGAVGMLTIFRGDGEGGFVSAIQEVWGNAQRFEVVDVDADGWLDVVEGGGVHLQRTGGGAIDWSRSLPAPLGEAVLVDYDGDGGVELLSGLPDTASPWLLWPVGR